MRLTIAVFGSLGDLHPMMALAVALRARGVEITIATHSDYKSKIETAGFRFHAVGLSMEDYHSQTGVPIATLPKRMAQDPGFIFRTIIGPNILPEIDAILPLVREADAVIGTTLAFSAHIAALKTGKPFIVSHLSPAVLFSTYDPIKTPDAPFWSNPGPVGRAYNRFLLALGGLKIRRSLTQVRRAYSLHGLKPDLRLVSLNSNCLTLALYSPLIAGAQPDHPANMHITGAPIYDSLDGHEPQLAPQLSKFLDAGAPPLVFTLGSLAVFAGESFYRTAITVAEKLGQRCVILAGSDSPLLDKVYGQKVCVTAYAPHSLLFPRCRAIVHHGGIGSTLQALRSGQPQLITPVNADQFDNAWRVKRLGAGDVLDFKRWNIARATSKLAKIIAAPAMHAKAQTLALQFEQEDGANVAADLIVNHLQKQNSHTL